MIALTPPDRLYKYRSFCANTLTSIFDDNIFLSDFDKLNDPWEGRPHIVPDMPLEHLEILLLDLSSYKEFMKARSLGIGNDLYSHIVKTALRKRLSIIREEIEGEFDSRFKIKRKYQNIILSMILNEVVGMNDFGVFSLSETCTSTLMWSHYGDEHEGICIGYSRGQKEADRIHKVKYGGTRSIPASLIRRMVAGDKDAKDKIRDTSILNKSYDWKYEKEWRIVGEKGLQPSSLELEEIIFGLRCPNSIICSIMKTFEDRDVKLNYYKISSSKSRRLIKSRIDENFPKENPPLRRNDSYDWRSML